MASGFDRRAFIGAALATAPSLAFAKAEGLPVPLSGKRTQGAALIGRTRPGATIALDGEAVSEASGRGFFVIGFDRDAESHARLAVSRKTWRAEEALTIAPVAYDIQKVDGLPQDTVTPEDPLLLQRIAQEAERKAKGFASRVDSDDFKDGFAMPLKATRVSGRFGGQRILNGVPNRPHYGADLAAPIGTTVSAPAAGTVSFAETGLHYEGGLVMIDHGQGLITAYLHMSKVLVGAGDKVARGQPIGEVGMEGRATGPHLCWRMKWRGRNLDPTLLVGVEAPKARAS